MKNETEMTKSSALKAIAELKAFVEKYDTEEKPRITQSMIRSGVRFKSDIAIYKYPYIVVNGQWRSEWVLSGFDDNAYSLHNEGPFDIDELIKFLEKKKCRLLT